MAKFSRQKAAKRPQNTGLKATAAKRPHFAHGWYSIYAKCVPAESNLGSCVVASLSLGSVWPGQIVGGKQLQTSSVEQIARFTS